MKKILLLVLLLIPYSKVNASFCSYKELAELREIASNITYRYDYIESDDNIVFNISLANLTPDTYILDSETNQTYYFSKSEIVISGYQDDTSVGFKVYSDNSDCEGQLLSTIWVNLPTYNEYYKDPLCETIPNYSLCNRWSTHTLRYDEFVQNIKDYLEPDDVIVIPEVEEEDSIWDLALELLLNYYYIPLLLIILIAGISIYRINKRDNIYN